MREWNGFSDGERYHEAVTTPEGVLVIEGSLHLTSDTVALVDLLIEPLETKHIPVGTKSIFAIWRSMMVAARAQGYTYVQVEGVRTSGAHPHHIVRLRRRV